MTAEEAGSLGQRARRGSAISIGGQAASQLLRLAGNLILTRLLFPEAFGLMAIVTLVLLGLQQISHVGIQPAIVRHARGDEQDFLDSAWTLQALRGALLFVMALALSIPVARFYGEPTLAPLLAVASLTALLSGFYSTKLVTATRRLTLGWPVALELAGQATALVVMVAVAWQTRSVWALLVGGLVSNAVRLAGSHLLIPGPRNRFRWEPEAVREIFGFGKWIFVSTLFIFLSMRMDVALLGRLLPLATLGVYSIGILLPSIVRDVSTGVIQAVLMPALSESHREGREALAESLATARRVVLPVGLLGVLGATMVAPAFFAYLYDARYHDAGWIAQLTLAGLWFVYLQETSGRALLALGDSRAWAFAAIARTVAVLAGCLLGFWLGDLPGLLVGLAIASACGYAVVVIALAGHDLHVLRADLAYTGLGLALGLPGALVPVWAAARLDAGSVPLLTLGAGALLLLPLAGFTVRRVRREGRS